MANIQVKLRRGTTTEHTSFAGAEGEVTVDTDLDTLMVHTGGGAGTGVRLAKHSELGGGSGTVTSVGSGTGLTGGPVTTTGTLSIANSGVDTLQLADDAVTADKLAHTAVTPGAYTSADITVDQQGRITAAASGSGGAVSKYSSGWFNDSGAGLSNGSTYSFTHGLGTSEVQVQVWMAKDASGTDAKEVGQELVQAGGINLEWGCFIDAITSSTVDVLLLQEGWVEYNATGHVSGNWGTTYTHIKVVVIG